MILKFCIYIVVFWAQLLIAEATSIDELQFWEPDPKFDYRRNNEVKRNPDREQNNQKFTYKRSKINSSRIQETIKPLLRTTRLIKPQLRTKGRYPKNVSHLVKPQFRSQEEIVKNGSQLTKFRSHQTKAMDSVRQQSKALRSKRGRQGDDHKSTRIALNDEKQTIPEKKWWSLSESNNGTENRYRLSPYSIAQQLEQLTSTMPKANVTMEVLGRTAEYNDIVLLKVTENKSEKEKYFRADDSKYMDDVSEKKIVFIVHALTVMGVSSMSVFKYSHYISKLLSYYFAHLDKFDIFLIPMANPDGFAHVMGRSYFWNKNLSPQDVCAGVALDRNFDVAWNISKPVSSCSQQYPGSSPFTEPETRAIRDVFHRYSHKIVAYMHLHPGSYNADSFKGDAVLYPKGYTDTQLDDDKYIDLKGDIEEAMKNASFKYLTVTVDTLHNWYGKVSGTSVDYASTVYGIPYAMELVMQIYQNVSPVSTEEDLENNALEEIWARVIDVILKGIWKSLTANDI